MTVKSQLLARIILSLGVTVGIIGTYNQTTLAQSADNLGGQEIYQTNEIDSNSSSLGNSVNPWQILHNIQLNNGRSMTEFNQESSRNIDTAATEYKRRLQQIWLQQQTPTTAPTPNTTETNQ